MIQIAYMQIFEMWQYGIIYSSVWEVIHVKPGADSNLINVWLIICISIFSADMCKQQVLCLYTSNKCCFSFHYVFLVLLFIIGEELHLSIQAHVHTPTVKESDCKPSKIPRRKKMH